MSPMSKDPKVLFINLELLNVLDIKYFSNQYSTLRRTLMLIKYTENKNWRQIKENMNIHM